MQYQGCSLLSALMTKKHRRVRARLGTAASALELVLDCRAVRRPAPHPSPRGRYRAPARPQRLKSPSGRAGKKKRRKASTSGAPSHTPTRPVRMVGLSAMSSFLARSEPPPTSKIPPPLERRGGKGGDLLRGFGVLPCVRAWRLRIKYVSAVQRLWLRLSPLGIVVTSAT